MVTGVNQFTERGKYILRGVLFRSKESGLKTVEKIWLKKVASIHKSGLKCRINNSRNPVRQLELYVCEYEEA